MKLTIRLIPISRINPAPYNPRKDLQPGDAEYEKLKRSLDTFGCVEPLVWNQQTGNLVGGHQRFKVLRERGEVKVSVSVVDLALEQEKALNIALNKVQGDWDEDLLAALLQDLGGDPGFDVSITGFDQAELGELLDRVNWQEETSEDDFDLDDALEQAESLPPVTQPGELLDLGRHRLLCGDSAKAEDVARVLDGRKADVVFTDPPYNVAYYGGDRPTPQKARPKQSRQWQRIYMDDLSQSDYESWLRQILDHVLDSMAPGAAFYVWNGHRQFGPMHTMLTEKQIHVSSVITWAKESFAIGYGDYNQQTEFCLYGWKQGGGAHRWFGPTNESTLWQIRRDRTKSYNHPTQKPIALAGRALRNSSRRGDTVLDVFLGSGSTLIAAEGLERRCCGIEIDPRYCDAIARRYIACVGEENAEPQLVERFRLEVTV
ncbi:MAG: DNA modification methylase [Phycisphaerales bacterium]|nr:DNA modification methylase [Phycisphaerales bacterium]